MSFLTTDSNNYPEMNNDYSAKPRPILQFQYLANGSVLFRMAPSNPQPFYPSNPNPSTRRAPYDSRLLFPSCSSSFRRSPLASSSPPIHQPLGLLTSLVLFRPFRSYSLVILNPRPADSLTAPPPDRGPSVGMQNQLSATRRS